MRLLFASLALALGSAHAAPVKITFWHSMDGSRDLVARLAADFNRAQSQYEVVPVVAGDYREAPAKLEAALKAGNPPALFQAELTYFPKLVADGRLANLERFENTLSPEVVQDFYPAVWAYGDLGGKRFGLPWNVSTPTLFYNARALRRAHQAPPKTYAELEATARALSGRGKRGFLAVAEAWTFEQIVAANGGSVVKDGAPNFTSPEVVASLEFLTRMTRGGTASAHTVGEARRAAVDFVRGVDSMAVASVANWTDLGRLGVFIEVGAAPVPCAAKCAVPFGGAQLVVLSSASAAEQAGAFAFWQFLMQPANLKTWVEGTLYLPPRKSVQPLLADFFKQNPQRQAVFAQLDYAVGRPRVPQYDTWRGFLEEAIAKAIKGGAAPRDALQEAQNRALGAR